MITVFYLLTAVCLMYEVIALFGAKKIAAGVKKYKDVKDPKMFSPEYLTFLVFNYIYLFFCLVGLMSSQWIGFALIFILALIPKCNLLWRRIDAILGIVILVFILLNKYQFHIDFNYLLINYLSK